MAVHRRRGETERDVRSRLIANNSLMLRDMLVAGLGIGSLPSFVADPEIAAGRLVRLFLNRLPKRIRSSRFTRRAGMCSRK